MTSRSGDLGVPLAAWGWGRQRGASSYKWVVSVFVCPKKYHLSC